MHPCDDTHTLVVVVGSLHYGLHLVGTVGCALVNHLDGDNARIVQTIHHLLGVTIYLYHGVASVKKLCTCYPPNL